MPQSGADATRLCQVWFPGVHINVGGGSTENIKTVPREDREQFADITLAWMLDMTQPYLALSQERINQELGITDNLRQVSYGSGTIYNSYSLTYRIFLGGAKIRTPAAYHDSGHAYTVERIHHSVHFRQDANDYEPVALGGWERRRITHEGRTGWIWQKNGTDLQLWEFQLATMEDDISVERRLIDSFQDRRASEMLQQLDTEWV